MSSKVGAVARSMALDVTTVQVVTALMEAGVPSVLLKGPATAYWLYGECPEQRPYHDVDLLVSPGDFARAGNVLGGRGFEYMCAGARPRETARLDAQTWFRDGAFPATVDLHRSFHGVMNRETFWTLMVGNAVDLPLLGTSLLIPDAAGIALIAALHATEPGPAGTAGKPARDLTRACVRLDASVWRAAARRAKGADAMESFAVGLRLDPAGILLASQLNLPRTLPPKSMTLTVLLESGIVSHEHPGRGAVRMRAFAEARGLHERLQLITDVLFPSPPMLRAVNPLAARGRAWLWVAYALRPLELARRLPATMSVLQVARKRARLSGWRSTPSRGPILSPGMTQAALWTLMSGAQARRQLRAGGLDAVRLLAPPAAVGRHDERAVRAVLLWRRATCLESAVVRQAWLARQGDCRDIVIGVRPPAEGFRAHAWLADDPENVSAFAELLRRPWSSR